ncbi:MAG TPA: hypothetical protein VF682_20465 [Pseudomonas sp.]
MAISTNEKIFLIVGLLDFSGIFIYLGISYYLASTKMELMLFHLSNCRAVMSRTPSLRLGLTGKMYVFAGIIAVLTMPRRLIRKGGANAEDIANFPPGLRRKIVVLNWSGVALLLVMCVLWLIIEFELI